MLRIHKPFIFAALMLLVLTSSGQSLKGHFKFLNSLFIPYPDTLIWFTDQTLDNRLELKWDKLEWLNVEVHARSRFIYGDFVENIPGYGDLLDSKSDYFDLSLLWANQHSFVGLTELDRLFAQFRFNQAELTIGRQRINWGMDLTWNPNDIFNTFSYLNLEYPERPGTDAVDLKVYSGSLSFVEGVFQPKKDIDSSAYGIRYKTVLGSTECQVILSNMATHYVAGGGFTAGLGQLALRSEFSYFHSHGSLHENGVVATLSADRSFASSGFVQLGILFNSFGSSDIASPFSFIEPRAQSPMMLSRGKINLMAGVNGTVRTLFSPSLAVLANPQDGSAVIIPSLSYSASNDLTLALTAMLLSGKPTTEYPNTGQLAYLKLQWNF